jgi:hypothetical protein
MHRVFNYLLRGEALDARLHRRGLRCSNLCQLDAQFIGAAGVRRPSSCRELAVSHAVAVDKAQARVPVALVAERLKSVGDLIGSARTDRYRVATIIDLVVWGA